MFMSPGSLSSNVPPANLPINVLFRRDGIGNEMCIDRRFRVEWHLHDNAMEARILVKSFDLVEEAIDKQTIQYYMCSSQHTAVVLGC